MNNDIIIASSAGFCPGVKNAIEKVLQLAKEGKTPVYTIGPLIHNRQVIDMLTKYNIVAIDSLNEATNKQGVLVIRAHGITPEFQKEVMAQNMQVIDCTCPLVKRVHNVISEFAQKDYDTIIVGDSKHAEVIGLLGYTKGRGVVVADEYEAQKLPNYKKVNVVAQTTQKEETFIKVAKVIKQKAEICEISNTICNPTRQRQKETITLAKNVELVIVVGGKHSANTARLAKICEELCKKVLHIESATDLIGEETLILGVKNILITAGASTPDWLIDEVAKKVQDIRSVKL